MSTMMLHLSTRQQMLCAVLATAMGAVLPHGPAVAAPSLPAATAGLSVCIDMSSAVAPVDRKLAQAVADLRHLPLTVHEFDGSGGDDGYDTKQFRQLAAEQCQIVLGFPVDATRANLPDGLAATAPYGGIGFVLVTPRSSHAGSLNALPKGTDVAVTYETMPNLYFADHPNIAADIYQKDSDTIQSLTQHHDRAAMLWRPTIVAYLMQHNLAHDYAWHQLNEPHAHWYLVGLHAPGAADAAAAFDSSVASLRSNGSLASLLSPYASVVSGATHASDRSEASPLSDGVVREAASAAPVLLVSAEAAMTQPATGGGPGDTAPALYTADQATAGKQKFADNCAQCHGDNLEGMAGPALKGDLFANAKANFHVGDIFNIVVKNMPSTQPGSLSHEDYTQIMSFILQQNGYPAGPAPLVFETALDSKVPLIYRVK